MQKCDLTDAGIKLFAKEVPQLKFLDLTAIPGVTVALLDEIKQKKPNLVLRQYKANMKEKFDPKDNGLRVPRQIIEEKKKKGKKK